MIGHRFSVRHCKTSYDRSITAVFEESHVFSIFNLRIHACKKNKITTTFLPLAVKISDSSAVKICSIQRCNFKDRCGIKLKIILKKHSEKKTVNTLRPRDSFCFSHFLFPNFKRPIPAQKWILKQQVRVPLNVPLNIPKQRTKITCQCTINRRSAKLILFVSFRVRHGEKQEEQSSQNMFLLYPVVQIWQAVAPDFLNITCRMSRKYFMNNFGLSKCSEIRTLSDRRMPGETQGRWELWGGKLLPMRANHCKNVSRITEEKHNARCGLVAGMKVIGQVFLPRETYTVHYTVKRKVWAGLKPIWLVQVWRQRYLESIVLDLRVRTYTSISAFTQKDWNPPTLFFNLTSSGPYSLIHTDWSIILHCAMSLLYGQRWY